MVVLCTTVIAFPLLLDRDVGAYEAIHASVRAVLANPIPMASWGLMVAVLLMIGSLPLFAGLAIVLADPWPRHLASVPEGRRAGAVGAQSGLRFLRAGRPCADRLAIRMPLKQFQKKNASSRRAEEAPKLN